MGEGGGGLHSTQATKSASGTDLLKPISLAASQKAGAADLSHRHSLLTPGQPVLELISQPQTHGKVGTTMAVSN